MPIPEFHSSPSIEPMDLTALRTEFVTLRRKLKYTQTYVAKEHLGITQATLSAWETGKNQSMRPETLNKLFHLVGQWRRQSISAGTGNAQVGNNIVPLGRGNESKEQRLERSSSPADDVGEARDEERSTLESAILDFLGPERAGGALLRTMPFDNLVKLYREVKQDQRELEILLGKW